MKIRVVHGLARRRHSVLRNNNKTLADRLENLNLSGLNNQKIETGTGLNGVFSKSAGSFKALGKKKLRF